MVERDVGGSGRGQEAKVEIQSQASAEEGDWPGVSGRHPSCSSIPSPREGGGAEVGLVVTSGAVFLEGGHSDHRTAHVVLAVV